MKRTAVLILAFWTSACTTWSIQGQPIGTVMQSHPSKVRITTSSARVELTSPGLKGDTLYGVGSVGGSTYDGGVIALRESHYAFAVNEITALEIHKVSASRTAFFILGSAALGTLIVGVVAAVAVGNGLCKGLYGCSSTQ